MIDREAIDPRFQNLGKDSIQFILFHHLPIIVGHFTLHFVHPIDNLLYFVWREDIGGEQLLLELLWVFEVANEDMICCEIAWYTT